MAKTDKIDNLCKEFPGLLTVLAHFHPEVLHNKKLRQSTRVRVEVADAPFLFYRGHFYSGAVPGGQPFMPPWRAPMSEFLRELLQRKGLQSLTERAFVIDSDQVVGCEHTWVQEDDRLVVDLLRPPFLTTGKDVLYVIRFVKTVWKTDSGWNPFTEEMDITIHKAPRRSLGTHQGREYYDETMRHLLAGIDPAKQQMIDFGGGGTFLGTHPAISDPIFQFANPSLGEQVAAFFEFVQSSGLITAIKEAAYYGTSKSRIAFGDVELVAKVWKKETGAIEIPGHACIDLRKGDNWLMFQLGLNREPDSSGYNSFKGLHATLETALAMLSTFVKEWRGGESKLVAIEDPADY